MLSSHEIIFFKISPFMLNLLRTIHLMSTRAIFLSFALIRYFLNTNQVVIFEMITVWYILLLLTLSSDIHPNPGPELDRSYRNGVFSFCNWNLNTLSKNNFYRVTLLESHSLVNKYDIISLCETSLNDDIELDLNIFPGYRFVSLNNPDGSANGGVGIFYKEHLPLRVRRDLSFGESLVVEMKFGRKKIFFTVVYRNPINKAYSPEFSTFLDNFKDLHMKINVENPYACFFAGDFNGHSQSWYPDGDTNPEGTMLDDLFTSLNLTQLISEPTHYFREHCLPSCIDLIITDQPNLVLESGVRSSLDPTVKHQIIFCNFNFKIPCPPKYSRRIWHFSRARHDLINQSLGTINWEQELRQYENPTDQVQFFNETILNILSNFIPNEEKQFQPRNQPWFNEEIKKLTKKHSLV